MINLKNIIVKLCYAIKFSIPTIKFTLVLILPLLVTFQVSAQFTSELKPLNIGDTIPANFWELKHEILANQQTTFQTLAPHRGKFLIIDFWATWCSPCVAGIPKLQQLQAQFSENLKILPVTNETETHLKYWLPLQEKRMDLKFRMDQLVNDNVLAKLFPHKVLPHYVWIDQQGIIRAITGIDDINQERIKEFLSKNSKKVKMKKDVMLDHDRLKPLYLAGNGGSGKQLIQHSMLTSYIAGIHPGLNRTRDTTFGTKILFRNQSGPKMLVDSYGNFNRKNTIYKIADSNLFRLPKGMDVYDWMAKYTYCYEGVFPDEMGGNISQMVREDLLRMFPNYTTEIKKQKIKCLALVRSGNTNALKTSGGEAAHGFSPFAFKLHNTSLSLLIAYLDNVYMQNSPKIIDLTGIKTDVNLEVEADLTNVASLNLALAKYGLKLIEKQAKVEVLIIGEKKGEIDKLVGLKRALIK